jgi:glutathione S-transferase
VRANAVIFDQQDVYFMPIKHSQEFELYSYGESLASQTARVGLAEKMIDYQQHRIGLESTGEHLQQAYKAINPRSLVPTLVHRGEPIYDSVKILEYLDAWAPNQGARLYPADNKHNAQVQALVREFALDESIEIGDNLGTSVAGISTQMLAYLLCKRPLWTVIWEYLTQHPSRERVPIFIMLRILGRPPRFKYRQFVRGVARGMVLVENALAHGEAFIAGEYSAADVLLAQLFHRLEITAFHSVLQSDQLPMIRAYWPRLQQRESYQAGIVNFEEDEWRECKATLYGERDNPDVGHFWAEVARLRHEQTRLNQRENNP